MTPPRPHNDRRKGCCGINEDHFTVDEPRPPEGKPSPPWKVRYEDGDVWGNDTKKQL
jgi:hypothetical protein